MKKGKDFDHCSLKFSYYVLHTDVVVLFLVINSLILIISFEVWFGLKQSIESRLDMKKDREIAYFDHLK